MDESYDKLVKRMKIEEVIQPEIALGNAIIWFISQKVFVTNKLYMIRNVHQKNISFEINIKTIDSIFFLFKIVHKYFRTTIPEK